MRAVTLSGPLKMLIVAGLCLVLPVACQPAGDDVNRQGTRTETLHFFTWADYTSPDLIEEFERQAGVKVVVDTFSSNEEMLAKLQSGAGGYDVVVPSDFMVSIMIRLGLLAELDHSKISNLAQISPELQQLPFDPDNRVSVPYLWSTTGIGYDSAVVPTPPDSWEVLWDRRYKGKVSMLNDQREIFSVGLFLLGQSPNTQDPALIHRAKDRLLLQKPLVKTYSNDNFSHLLASGEVVLAQGWGGMVARAMLERPSIRYVIPKEGGTIWADCLVVLKASKNREVAMQFINYLLDRTVAAKTTNRLLYASSNGEAKALVDPAILANPAVYPPQSAFARLHWMTDVGEAIRVYDRAWTELKLL
jgi:spermidine/putrescine-binding protein